MQVEIADGDSIRVWVIDTSDGPAMYHDAPPEVAERLLAGVPVSMTRNGRVTRACAAAAPIDALPEEQVAGLLRVMEEKYAGRNTATAVFYAVLGVRRDSVGLLLRLEPCA